MGNKEIMTEHLGAVEIAQVGTIRASKSVMIARNLYNGSVTVRSRENGTWVYAERHVIGYGLI